MQIQRIKVFHFPATRSTRVLWAAHELASHLPIEVEKEVIDLYGNQQFAREYLAMNPNHNVPTTRIEFDDGSSIIMLESVATVMFLADSLTNGGLAPAPGVTAARADYLQMMSFCGAHMDMMLWQIRIHEHVLPADKCDKGTAARYREKMAVEVEPQLLKRLGGGDFICGEEFTAADCVAGHCVTWARGYGMCQDDAFRKYLSRLSKRPAFLHAFADARDFNPVPPGREENNRFNG